MGVVFMLTYNTDKQKKLSAFLWFPLLAAAGLLAFIIYTRSEAASYNLSEDDGRMTADLAQFSTENYESILLSMHSTQNFRKEDYSLFLNQDILIASHCLLNMEEFSGYLDCAFRSGNEVSHVYLSLDPELLWNAVGKSSRKWNRNLADYLYLYIENHPNVSFEVLLPYPYINYWLSFSEKKLDTLLAVYHNLVDGLCAYPNVKVYFPGEEYWLMVNPGNYENSLFDANEVIAQKLFLYTFCDSLYQITPENEADMWDTLRTIIAREKSSPTHYPDLSDWCLVFFGDSILGNFEGSYSIPGYINGLSNAVVYNYAIGGSSASLRTENGYDFPNVMDSFFTDDILISNGHAMFCPAGAQDGELEGRKLCFVINFGINDFLSCTPLDNPADPFDPSTYKGALRACISRLQGDFPDAYIILVSPTHIICDDTEQPGHSLAAYNKALEEISGEMNLFFIDNYNDFVITQDNLWDYLSDGYHPNEKGRLAIAANIMYFMEENLP